MKLARRDISDTSDLCEVSREAEGHMAAVTAANRRGPRRRAASLWRSGHERREVQPGRTDGRTDRRADALTGRGGAKGIGCNSRLLIETRSETSSSFLKEERVVGGSTEAASSDD